MSCKYGEHGVGSIHAKPSNEGAIMATTWKALFGREVNHNPSSFVAWNGVLG